MIESEVIVIEAYYKNECATLYKGDNLELLKKLPSDYIDLIYCDILYGTGRNFGDYQDLKPDKKVIEAHYIPRFEEMHRVLQSHGSIFIQMDYRISHWIRIILDNIFTYNNFRNEIIWCYRSGGKTKQQFSNKHDNIFWYSKTNDYIFNVKDVMIENKNKSNYKKNKNGKEYNYNMSLPIDWWDDCTPLLSSQCEEYLPYPTQKPKSLLNRIIKACSNEGQLVADFYMGSGTTGEVALELSRRFLGCDISEKACTLSKDRISKYII